MNNIVTLDVARRYDAAGLNVLPPKQDGSKAPLAAWKDRSGQPTWKPAQHESTAAKLAGWYADGRDGIGVVTGEISGGLEMFEFDDPEVAEAFVEAAPAVGLGELVDRIRSGYSERTPAGGGHWLYRFVWDGEGPRPGAVKLAERPIPTDANRLARKTLIETKGEGGFAILAPSGGRTHPTGGDYVLLAGRVEDIVDITIEERDELFALARSFDEKPPQPPREAPAPRAAPGGPHGRPGDEFNESSNWNEVLGPHGWREVRTRGQITDWRRPGKTWGLSATTNFLGTDTMMVFSTSTPFDIQPASYSKFGAYAVLNHGGDFGAAAHELARQGYGGTSSMGLNSRRQMVERPWPDPPGPAAFVGLAGDLVRAIAPHTEADDVAVLANILAAFGNVIGRGAWAQVGATRHHAHEFFVLTGRTAKARKGESWTPVRMLFEAAAPGWLTYSGLSTGEGLIHAVRDPVWKQEQLKEKGRPTEEFIEVMVDEGVADKRLLVIEPELGRMLAVLERAGNTLSSVVRDAWDGNTLRVMTRSNPLTATAAHISLVGHVTIEELTALLDEVSRANGFANRFLFLTVRRSKTLPEPEAFTAEKVAYLAGRLAKAIEFARGVGEVRRTPAARELWIAMYPTLSAERDGLAGALSARAEAHMVRLSLIYALLDCSPVVDIQHLQAACELWAFSERSLEYIFGDRIGDPVADTLWNALAAGPLTRTQIRDLFGRNVGAARIEDALAGLARRGLARPRREATGGHPVEVWEAIA